MRFELKDLQRRLGTTFIYVTHDQEEALTMSDRIAVMDQGRLLQVGTPMQVYDTPSNHFVADFVGETNFLDCQVLSSEGDRARVRIGGEIDIEVASQGPASAGQEGRVIIRPEKIDLHEDKAEAGEEDVVLTGEVVERFWIGTDTRFAVALSTGTQMVVRHQNMELGDSRADLAPGDRVYLSWQTIAARLLTG
jgi:spermidine/putrescine transport system ATP-binding protein